MTEDIPEHEETARRINDAIERGGWPGEQNTVVRMHCECGRPGCTAFLRIRLGDYEALRSNARRFVVCEGHETDAVEAVVRRCPGYLIVEKTGSAGQSAERSATRD